MDTVLCSIPDAAKALSLGRSKTYQLIEEGQLETVRIGRRRLVVTSSIRRLAEDCRVDGQSRCPAAS
jgi:excisionase family DNA binding protein